MAPDFEHTSDIRAARKAVAETKRGRKSTERIIAQSSSIMDSLAASHRGPDYFVEKLRETIRGN